MAAEKIFLVGMMGSGKSHWTKKIAKWIKSGGYDLDDLIEMNDLVEDIFITPTVQEAKDVIEFEEIERDLGF